MTKTQAIRERKAHIAEKVSAGETCITCRFSEGAYGATTFCPQQNEFRPFHSTCDGWKAVAFGGNDGR